MLSIKTQNCSKYWWVFWEIMLISNKIYGCRKTVFCSLGYLANILKKESRPYHTFLRNVWFKWMPWSWQAIKRPAFHIHYTCFHLYTWKTCADYTFINTTHDGIGIKGSFGSKLDYFTVDCYTSLYCWNVMLWFRRSVKLNMRNYRINWIPDTHSILVKRGCSLHDQL